MAGIFDASDLEFLEDVEEGEDVVVAPAIVIFGRVGIA